jgi:Uma2 family endonuclease
MSLVESPIFQEEISLDMPSRNHSKLQVRISSLLSVAYEEIYDVFTELSVEINGKTLAPDICIYPISEEDWRKDEITMSKPPITVIEILSPKQAVQDLVDKFDEYFKAGVKSCWLVIPTLEIVDVFTANIHQKQTYTAGIITDLASNVAIDINKIFRKKLLIL